MQPAFFLVAAIATGLVTVLASIIAVVVWLVRRKQTGGVRTAATFGAGCLSVLVLTGCVVTCALAFAAHRARERKHDAVHAEQARRIEDMRSEEARRTERQQELKERLRARLSARDPRVDFKLDGAFDVGAVTRWLRENSDADVEIEITTEPSPKGVRAHFTLRPPATLDPRDGLRELEDRLIKASPQLDLTGVEWDLRSSTFGQPSDDAQREPATREKPHKRSPRDAQFPHELRGG